MTNRPKIIPQEIADIQGDRSKIDWGEVECAKLGFKPHFSPYGNTSENLEKAQRIWRALNGGE